MALLLPDRPHELNIEENRALLARETLELEGVVEIRGAAALLAQLDGLRHALVTSATRELAAARMGAAGVPMPAVAVTAEDARIGKPDPEVFLTAATWLEVDHAACVVVEDSANGIAAGLAAGMRVIGVGAGAVQHGADWTVPDLSGVQVTADEEGLTITLSRVV